MKKVDLSKYLTLSTEDQRALGMIVGVDPAKGSDQSVVRYAQMSPALGAPYQMGKKAKCPHRVSLRERQDLKPKKLPNGVLATAHTCLECGVVMWRLHPGPRRQRRFQEEVEDEG